MEKKFLSNFDFFDKKREDLDDIFSTLEQIKKEEKEIKDRIQKKYKKAKIKDKTKDIQKNFEQKTEKEFIRQEVSKIITDIDTKAPKIRKIQPKKKQEDVLETLYFFITEKAPQLNWIIDIFYKVDDYQLYVFTKEFAAMQNAGIPLLKSLEILGRDTESIRLKYVIQEIYKAVYEGKKLSSAIAKYPDVFSKLYLGMVLSGEASGNLGENLENLAINLEKAYSVKKKIKSALTYPILVIFFAIGISFFIFNFILPNILQVIESFNVELPFYTVIIIYITHAIKNPIVDIILLLIVGIIAYIIFMLNKIPKGKELIDNILFKTPIIQPILRYSLIITFSSNLSTLLESGIPLSEALGVISKISSNIIFKKVMAHTLQLLKDGYSLAAAFSPDSLYIQKLTKKLKKLKEKQEKKDEELSEIEEIKQELAELKAGIRTKKKNKEDKKETEKINVKAEAQKKLLEEELRAYRFVKIIFSDMVVQMIKIGEETGELSYTLAKVAEYYEEELDRFLDNLSSLIEPILMGGVGVMVGTILMAVMVPLYGLIGKLG